MNVIIIGKGFLLTAIYNLVLAQKGTVNAIFSDDPTAQKKYGTLTSVFSEKEICNPQHPIHQSDKTSWLISAESTMLIPENILALYHERAINFHPGLLPEYAGLYTYQWAIINQEAYTGVSLHFMEAGLDTGDIIAQQRFEISEKDTGLSVYKNCVSTASKLFAPLIEAIANNEEIPRTKQDLSKRHLYKKSDILRLNIDWQQPAAYNINLIRAANFEPFVPPSIIPTHDGWHVLRAQLLDLLPDSIRKAQEKTWRKHHYIQRAGDGRDVLLTRMRDLESNAIKIAEGV